MLINHVLALLVSSLAMLVGRKPTTWFLDGDNILAARGTPRQADALVEKLEPVAYSDSVVLVFDGKKPSADDDGASEPSERKVVVSGASGLFRHVHLEEGMSADEYILDEIENLSAESKTHRVKLVTADKKLRRSALSIRPTVKTVVNPVTFYKKHRPRMAGLKKRDEDDEEGRQETNQS